MPLAVRRGTLERDARVRPDDLDRTHRAGEEFRGPIVDVPLLLSLEALANPAPLSANLSSRYAAGRSARISSKTRLNGGYGARHTVRYVSRKAANSNNPAC